tara:strand:+ start:931 stop:1221 length:291 start_codon:yes stop_codon:yes gene_type:complete
MKIVKLLDGVTSATTGAVYQSKFLRDNETGLVQAVFTGGDRAGTLKLEGSLDGTNFVEVTKFTESGSVAVTIFPFLRGDLSSVTGSSGTISLLLGD